jgi:dienelactone hydrolase
MKCMNTLCALLKPSRIIAGTATVSTQVRRIRSQAQLGMLVVAIGASTLVHGGIGGIGPIDGMTATGNSGLITSINGISVNELKLGQTTFPNPPTHAHFPAQNADNFDLSQVGSADDQPYFDVWFGQEVMAIFLIENHGNDSGFVQGLDAAGQPVGAAVGFTTSDYFQSIYRTANNQIASGLFVWTEAPVYGIRVTPPSGGLMGFDPVSVSGLLEAPAPPPPSSTLSLVPVDDAYLQGTTRFNDNYLKVEAGNRVSYLKFNVSGLSGTVQNATLRLQENGDVGSGTLRVFRGSHNSWTETTLSSANAPLENGQVGMFTGTVTSAQVVNIDVTPLITGNATYSVIVKMDAGGNDIWFGSEESARKPQLIIETSGTGTVTYSLTVNSGSGSGSYAAGTTVNIAAAAAPSGQVFDRWTGDVANVASVTAASTTITMPAGNATVTATYKLAGTGVGSIGGIGPIEGMTATGNSGFITSINGVPVNELRLGVTTFPNAPKHAEYPAVNGDNFDLSLLASGDDQPYIDIHFGQEVMAAFLIENGGNDSGFMRGLDAAGNPVGATVSFSTSDYLTTSYRTVNNQIASGLFVWMESAVYGIRITPPNGGLMGFDPVSVSAVGEPATSTGNLSALAGFSEVWNGQTLVWQKALYTDSEVGDEGASGIPFGLALPGGYSAGAGRKYPLVIYLHGADARGNNDNKNLQRQTARYFAHQARTVSSFNAFVLSPQVPTGQQFVGVEFNNGPYQQSATTLTAAMQLTENLIRYLTDPGNNTSLAATLGFSAAEVDVSRLYVVGDSMGAYGTWDTVGRGAIPYAAGIASAGSGPANRLAAVMATPLWVIHGEMDAVVPNYLPYLGDADGAGSLGMLGLIDPGFDNTTSTGNVRLDDYASAADDPTSADSLVYSQYPGQFDHVSVAANWTDSMVSNFSAWLFGHSTAGSVTGLTAISATMPPRLEMAWDTSVGGWQLVWHGSDWVLQETMSLDEGWTDISPRASSPHPLAMDGDNRFFRLRAVGQE